MAHPPIVAGTQGSTLAITLNRPEKRNALTFEMMEAIAAAVEKSVRDPAVRAVVLKGEGPVFSAGVDLNALAGLIGAVAGLEGRTGPCLRAEIHRAQQWLNRLEAIEVPIICAMHGGAYGMAIELALACDIRLMSADCTWGLPEAQYGIIADLGGTARLAKTIGAGRALEVLMTGGRYPADRALAWGLVNHLYPDREALAAGAEALAAAIANMAPLAVGAFKRIVKRGEGVDLMTQLGMEATLQSALLESADFQEGIAARFEKRPPAWKAK
jgi:enoyl-CoA hydratase/carnithine racemase